MYRQRQTLNRLTAAALEAMTDEQLQAIAAPLDLSEFTDQELQAIVNDTASPALLSRVMRTANTLSSQ